MLLFHKINLTIKQLLNKLLLFFKINQFINISKIIGQIYNYNYFMFIVLSYLYLTYKSGIILYLQNNKENL